MMTLLDSNLEVIVTSGEAVGGGPVLEVRGEFRLVQTLSTIVQSGYTPSTLFLQDEHMWDSFTMLTSCLSVIHGFEDEL